MQRHLFLMDNKVKYPLFAHAICVRVLFYSLAMKKETKFYSL